MNLINNITDDPNQMGTYVLGNGNSFTLSIYYVPMQYCWFITNITYAATNFICNSIRITNNANMLYQFQNIIPFGLACFSPSQREPTQQQDFSTGASNLYILTQAEVASLTTYIQGGALPA